MAVHRNPDPHIMTDTAVGNRLAWMKAIEVPEWMTEGLCGSHYPETWFPTVQRGRGPGINRRWAEANAPAKEICADCPVRAQCLEYALETNQRFGIWGGLDEYERRELRQKQSA